MVARKKKTVSARRASSSRTAVPTANRVALQLSHAQARPHGPWMEKQALQFLDALKLSGVELSMALVSDTAIRKLNRVWREKDTPTDVLSFPAGETPPGYPGARPLGDIIISLDTTVRQAREYGRTVKEELSRYLAHGLLHLLGYDHETPEDARKMAKREDALLGSPGMVRTAVAAPALKPGRGRAK